MPGIRDLVADPDFDKLSVGKQREALSQFDPQFSNLNDSQIGEFKVKLKNPPGVIERTFNPDQPGVTSQVPETQKIRDIKDVGRHILSGARPMLTGLGTAAGIAATGGASIPVTALAGVLSGVGTDLAVQKAQEGFGERPNTIPESLYSAGEMGAGNEAGGLITNKLMRLFGGLPAALKGNGPTNSPSFERLRPINDAMIEEGGGPSFSQQRQSGNLISKGMEDIMGGSAKQKQLQNAASAGTKVGVDLSNKISGQNISSFEDPFVVAQRFGGDLQKTKDMYIKASDGAAKEAKNFAALNPTRVQTGWEESKLLDAEGKKIRTPIYGEVKGPTNISNAVQMADQFMQNFDATYGTKSTAEIMKVVEDAKKPLVRTALDVLKYAERDKAGNITGITPIPFEAAWDLKKATADLGYAGNDIVPTGKQAKFRNLSHALDADIEGSMQNWRGGSQALNAYQEAKTLVSNRHELFQQGDEITKMLKAGSGDTAKPEFDRVLTDPLLTGKAIAASGPGGRSNLQAYQIQKLMQDSFDQKTGTYDRGKLLDQWNDPNKQGVYKKLYNQEQRQDIGNFVEALANVSQSTSNAGKFSTAIRIGNASTQIAGAALTGALTLGHFTNPAVVLGAAVSTSEITKRVLLNPKIARAATILMKQPASSAESKFLAREVFSALNGARIVLTTKDGNKPGTIRDGSFVPDSQ